MAKISSNENSTEEIFPLNDDGSLSLEVLKEKISGVIGLRYRYNGRLRAVKICSGYFFLPTGMTWDKSSFHCVYDESLDMAEERKEQTNLSTYYDLLPYDMIVMGIPETVESDEFETYFSKFGKLSSCELKKDTKTGRCRGYGFLKYTNFDDQYKCIISELKLRDTDLFLRLPSYNVEESVSQRRILVTNITPSVTMIDLLEYFSVFGKISQVFMPVTLVPYANITFEKSDSVANVFKFGESHRVFGGFVMVERLKSKKELEEVQSRKEHADTKNKSRDKDSGSVNCEALQAQYDLKFTATNKQTTVTQPVPLNGGNVFPPLTPQIATTNPYDNGIPIVYPINSGCPPPMGIINGQPPIQTQVQPAFYPNNNISQQMGMSANFEEQTRNNFDRPPQMYQQPQPFERSNIPSQMQGHFQSRPNWEGQAPLIQQNCFQGNNDAAPQMPRPLNPQYHNGGQIQQFHHQNNLEGGQQRSQSFDQCNNVNSLSQMAPQYHAQNSVNGEVPGSVPHHITPHAPLHIIHQGHGANQGSVEINQQYRNPNYIQNPQINFDGQPQGFPPSHNQNQFELRPQLPQQFPQVSNIEPTDHMSQPPELSSQYQYRGHFDGPPQMAQQFIHNNNIDANNHTALQQQNMNNSDVAAQIQPHSQGQQQFQNQLNGGNIFDGPPNNAHQFPNQNSLNCPPQMAPPCNYPPQRDQQGQPQYNYDDQRQRNQFSIPQNSAAQNTQQLQWENHSEPQPRYQPMAMPQQIHGNGNMDYPTQFVQHGYNDVSNGGQQSANQQLQATNQWEGRPLSSNQVYGVNNANISPMAIQPVQPSNDQNALQINNPGFMSPGSNQIQSPCNSVAAPQASRPGSSLDNWNIPSSSHQQMHHTNTHGPQFNNNFVHSNFPNTSNNQMCLPNNTGPPQSQVQSNGNELINLPNNTNLQHSSNLPMYQGGNISNPAFTSQPNVGHIPMSLNQQTYPGNCPGPNIHGPPANAMAGTLPTSQSYNPYNDFNANQHINISGNPLHNQSSIEKVNQATLMQCSSAPDMARQFGDKTSQGTNDMAITVGNSHSTKEDSGMLPLQLVSDVTMRLLKTCGSESEKKILAKLLLSVMSDSACSDAASTSGNMSSQSQPSQTVTKSQSPQVANQPTGTDIDSNQ